MTGWALYHEHRKMTDDGFVALIECDSERSAVAADTDRLKPEHAYRTGNVAHVRRELCTKLFDVPLEPFEDYVFVEVGGIDRLELLMKQATARSVRRDVALLDSGAALFAFKRSAADGQQLRRLQLPF